MGVRGFIKIIDAYISSFFPLVVVAYFCYRHSYFASHMFVVGWLSFVVNMTFTLETYKEIFTLRTSLSSLFNLLLFGALAYNGIISWDSFLIGFIMGDCAALIISIIYFFLFRKGLDGQTAWHSFGVGGTIGLIALFGVTIYPYLGEWILFLMGNEASFVGILAAVITFAINISRKTQMLASKIESRQRDPNYNRDEEIAAAMTSKLSPEARAIIIGLGLWFFGVGIVYAVYVHNA